uniref:LysR family transcriptional regulator n=1 Tax=Halomonas sp. TaxID=1486246 RepID=UPI00261EE74E|nr:LysR family transcriptional regulator [Halomonas sp.]
MKIRHHLRQLQIFQEVVRAGSLTKAARRLELSQPAVSAAIANLEQEVGFLLFRRNHYGTELTLEAEYLAEGVERVLTSLKHLGELSDGLRQGRAGKLLVGCKPGMSLSVMPRIMADYLSDYPDSQLSLQTFSSLHIRDAVSEGQFDVGVIEIQDDMHALDVTRYGIRLYLVLPENSPLIGHETVTAEDLNGLPFICLDEHHQSTIKLRNVMRAAGVNVHVVVSTHLFPSAIGLSNQGIGHTLVDALTAEQFMTRRDSRITVVPFEPSIDLDIAVVTSRYHSPSRQCQGFLPYLHASIEACQRHSQQFGARTSAGP